MHRYTVTGTDNGKPFKMQISEYDQALMVSESIDDGHLTDNFAAPCNVNRSIKEQVIGINPIQTC